MKTAGSDADVILLIFDPLDIHFTDEVIELLRSINKPILLAVNKIDTSENRKPM
jgi:GTP-binding protein Era